MENEISAKEIVEAPLESKNAESKFVGFVKDNVGLFQRAWVSFHNSIILALIFTIVGIGIGVHVSKKFYMDRMEEVRLTGAMLIDKKVYTVQLKP